MTEGSASLPGGVATGIGSLPGVKPREAAALVIGELPDLPHLAELPARGPWAGITGRGSALLVDLPVELSVGRWQFCDRPGRDLARARSQLAEDLDALQESLEGYTGSVKVQVCGPLTLAATVERRGGERALIDPGARRDLAVSMAEGLAEHIRDIRRRLPTLREVLVQLDEPAIAVAIAGALPTVSGFGRLAAVPVHEVEQLVRAVTSVIVDRGARTVIHTCVDSVPVDVLVNLGADALSLDLSRLGASPNQREALSAWLDGGRTLFAGLPMSDVTASVELVRRVLGECMGEGWLTVDRLTRQVVVTPPCGLAGVPEPEAVAVYAAARQVAQRLLDEAER